MKAALASTEAVEDFASTPLTAIPSSGGDRQALATSPALPASQQHLKPFLDLPQNISRASSPGTLSNLSTEEWHALQSTHKQNLSRASSWRPSLRAFWTRNLGLVYMLISNVFGVAMNVTVRVLEVEGNQGKGLHPFQVLFARMGITAVLCCTYMAYAKTPHFPFGMPEVRWLLMARGMGGFFGVFGMYYSLMYLPISDATVITYLAPGLACWACSFLIGESFTRVDKIGTMVSLLGVLFIARPASLFAGFSQSMRTPAGATSDVVASGNSTTHIHGAKDFDVTPGERVGAVGLALVGVLGAVSAITTIRWIGKRAHPLISVNYFACWSTMVSIVMQLTLPGVGFLLPSGLKDWGLLFFLGVCGFIMQFLLAAGLAYEKSSRATNMVYTSMLFALASDKIFFNTSPGISSIAGSVLIMGAAMSMALQKAQPVADPEEPTAGQGDEERGLMGDVEGTEEDRMPIQEVQMRTLR